MTTTAFAAAATQSGFYDKPESFSSDDFKKLAWLERCAAVLPMDIRDPVNPDVVHNLCRELEGMPRQTISDEGFEEAFDVFAKVFKGTSYEASGKTPSLRIGAYDTILEAFTKFNEAKSGVRLSGEGKEHFDARIRGRQIYWGMQHSGFSTTFAPVSFR